MKDQGKVRLGACVRLHRVQGFAAARAEAIDQLVPSPAAVWARCAILCAIL
jgi:hypothetical protein